MKVTVSTPHKNGREYLDKIYSFIHSGGMELLKTGEFNTPTCSIPIKAQSKTFVVVLEAHSQIANFTLSQSQDVNEPAISAQTVKKLTFIRFSNAAKGKTYFIDVHRNSELEKPESSWANLSLLHL